MKLSGSRLIFSSIARSIQLGLSGSKRSLCIIRKHCFLPQVAGETTFRNLDPELRERMLGNADVLVTIEMEAFASMAADISKLSNAKVPLLVAAGKDNANTNNPMLRGGYEAAKWLANSFTRNYTNSQEPTRRISKGRGNSLKS